jgi:hypothetical protein
MKKDNIEGTIDLTEENPVWIRLNLWQKLEVPLEVVLRDAKRKVDNKHYLKSKKFKERKEARKNGGYNKEEIWPSVN